MKRIKMNVPQEITTLLSLGFDVDGSVKVYLDKALVESLDTAEASAVIGTLELLKQDCANNYGKYQEEEEEDQL